MKIRPIIALIGNSTGFGEIPSGGSKFSVSAFHIDARALSAADLWVVYEAGVGAVA